MTCSITPARLAQLAGRRAPTPLMLDLAAPLMIQLAAAGILDSRPQTRHALAQWCQETDGFATLVEYGGPGYFTRYDGRADLGNTQPGDGYRFRGRGLTMLTGRDNYTTAGHALGLDLAGNPDLAAVPVHAVAIAVHYWRTRGLAAAAEADDIIRVTRLINGGLNGIARRRAALKRAKAIWP